MIKKIGSFLDKYRFLILILSGISILFDIFFLKFTSDFLIFFLTGLWVLVVKLYKFEGRVSVAVALGFLVLCPFLLIFKKEAIAEKAAIWAYMFLVVGVIQMFIEVKKEKR
jgi:hypothetical protein